MHKKIMASSGVLMIGFLFAIYSMAVMLASFALRDGLILPAFVLSGLFIAIAVFFKARPILLLSALMVCLLSLVLHPYGLQRLILQHHLMVDLNLPWHLAGVLFVSLLVVGLLFAISCRKHCGGIRFSAHEASEDIDRFISLFSRFASLFFLPLIFLPAYAASLEKTAVVPSPITLVSWQEPVTSFAGADTQMVSWSAALIMMGGMIAAFAQNAHHRFMLMRLRFGLKGQAWIDILGALILLLPLCWVMVRVGWNDQATIDGQAAFSLDFAELGLHLPLPEWGLYGLFSLLFLLLAFAGIGVILRSLVFLYGPHYLVKRSATHLEMSNRDHADKRADQTPHTNGWEG